MGRLSDGRGPKNLQRSVQIGRGEFLRRVSNRNGGKALEEGTLRGLLLFGAVPQFMFLSMLCR